MNALPTCNASTLAEAIHPRHGQVYSATVRTFSDRGYYGNSDRLRGRSGALRIGNCWRKTGDLSYWPCPSCLAMVSKCPPHPPLEVVIWDHGLDNDATAPPLSVPLLLSIDLPSEGQSAYRTCAYRSSKAAPIQPDSVRHLAYSYPRTFVLSTSLATPLQSCTRRFLMSNALHSKQDGHDIETTRHPSGSYFIKTK